MRDGGDLQGSRRSAPHRPDCAVSRRRGPDRRATRQCPMRARHSRNHCAGVPCRWPAGQAGAFGGCLAGAPGVRRLLGVATGRFVAEPEGARPRLARGEGGAPDLARTHALASKLEKADHERSFASGKVTTFFSGLPSGYSDPKTLDNPFETRNFTFHLQIYNSNAVVTALYDNWFSGRLHVKDTWG